MTTCPQCGAAACKEERTIEERIDALEAADKATDQAVIEDVVRRLVALEDKVQVETRVMSPDRQTVHWTGARVHLQLGHYGSWPECEHDTCVEIHKAFVSLGDSQ